MGGFLDKFKSLFSTSRQEDQPVDSEEEILREMGEKLEILAASLKIRFELEDNADAGGDKEAIAKSSLLAAASLMEITRLAEKLPAGKYDRIKRLAGRVKEEGVKDPRLLVDLSKEILSAQS